MIDEKNAISHAGEPSKQREIECVFANASFNYISRRHRAFLWMFRAIPSVDIDDKTGTITIMWCKYAFGKVFIVGEEIRKFEDKND